MMLKLPIEKAAFLLKHKNIDRILKCIATRRSVTSRCVAREAGVTVKVAWLALRDLTETEHLEKKDRRFVASSKIRDEYVLVNLRDLRSDRLFRWRATRKILYLLATRKEISQKEISIRTWVPYVTVRKILITLRDAGIIVGDELNTEFFLMPTDPIELVPRQVHQNVARQFLTALKTYRPSLTEPVVIFGEASWGKPTITIRIAALSKAATPPEEQIALADGLVLAASNVTSQFGLSVDLTLTTQDACLAQQLGFAKPVMLISEILDGICIHGRMPTPEDYFELAMETYPLSKERIQDMLRKGYLTKTEDGRLIHTPKGFEALRKKRKSKLIECEVERHGKKVRVIALSP